jgi:hypothetical protein
VRRIRIVLVRSYRYSGSSNSIGSSAWLISPSIEGGKSQGRGDGNTHPQRGFCWHPPPPSRVGGGFLLSCCPLLQSPRHGTPLPSTHPCGHANNPYAYAPLALNGLNSCSCPLPHGRLLRYVTAICLSSSLTILPMPSPTPPAPSMHTLSPTPLPAPSTTMPSPTPSSSPLPLLFALTLNICPLAPLLQSPRPCLCPQPQHFAHSFGAHSFVLCHTFDALTLALGSFTFALDAHAQQPRHIEK